MWLLGKVFDISGDKVSAIVTSLKYYFVEGDIFHIWQCNTGWSRIYQYTVFFYSG